MRKNKLLLLWIILGLFSKVNAQDQVSRRISIHTSHQNLAQAFQWAVEKALSHVQTGKSGVVDRWEKGDGTGPVAYLPCYWGGYNFRSAFYSRDICHQVVGGHLLNLDIENYTMLGEFAKTATAERKWYPLWALNFDGSPFKLDYRSDTDFVREVPAAFELVEKAYQLYRWTGDKQYLQDETLWNYYTHIVNEFIEWHDQRQPNGVAEGDGSGDIFRGVATYNEGRGIPLVEAGDGIACQFRALEAFAWMAKARGEVVRFREYAQRAENLKNYFNTQWSVKPGTKRLVRGYNRHGEALTNWGKENSWFMLLKNIAEPGARTEKYLDFVNKSARSKKGRPVNIEARSYLPETFFNNHRNKEGWQWLKDMIEHIDLRFPVDQTTGHGNYPEISFVIISNVVEGLMGVLPDAPDRQISTLSRLPGEIPDLTVNNISVGAALFSVSHLGTNQSVLCYQSGVGTYRWQARFYGHHPMIRVNGNTLKAQHQHWNGAYISYVEVEVKPGEIIQVKVETGK